MIWRCLFHGNFYIYYFCVYLRFVSIRKTSKHFSFLSPAPIISELLHEVYLITKAVIRKQEPMTYLKVSVPGPSWHPTMSLASIASPSLLWVIRNRPSERKRINGVKELKKVRHLLQQLKTNWVGRHCQLLSSICWHLHYPRAPSTEVPSFCSYSICNITQIVTKNLFLLLLVSCNLQSPSKLSQFSSDECFMWSSTS